MDTQPNFGIRELLSHIVGEVSKAVCQRAGESRQQQMVRSQAAAHTIMQFQPRDSIEAIFASHCLMFHEMIVDSAHTTLGGELEESRRATRASIIAMDKAFGNNLTRMRQYRAQVAKEQSEGRPVDVPTEKDIADRVRRHESEARPQAQSPAAAAYPSKEAIAACEANPEAMAALNAGDPARFARAMGVNQPSEGYLAAAAGQMSGFNQRSSPPQSRPGQSQPGQVKPSGQPVTRQ